MVSAILLFRNATTENQSVNWTTANCPRGGDKKQCQIPTWGVGTPGGVGVGHEIDKCIIIQWPLTTAFRRRRNNKFAANRSDDFFTSIRLTAVCSGRVPNTSKK